MTNSDIAKRLLEHARAIGPSQLFRARAYRHAAFVIQGLECTVEELLRERGRKGLAKLPSIGTHLAFTIETLVLTGEFIPYSERKQRRLNALNRVA